MAVVVVHHPAVSTTQVVLCEDPGEDDKRNFFTQAARKLRDKHIHSGVMDCKSPLPTGENARKRFGLKRSVGDPVIILAANTKKPHQVGSSRCEAAAARRGMMMRATTD